LFDEILVVTDAHDEPSVGPGVVCIADETIGPWRRVRGHWITIEVRRRDAAPLRISLDELLEFGHLSPDRQAWSVPISRFWGRP
jgi:hypothetical protein